MHPSDPGRMVTRISMLDDTREGSIQRSPHNALTLPRVGVWSHSPPAVQFCGRLTVVLPAHRQSATAVRGGGHVETAQDPSPPSAILLLSFRQGTTSEVGVRPLNLILSRIPARS